MTKQKYTLTSYDPIYAICPEVRIPEEEVRAMALRWLQLNHCKEGEKAKLTDKFVDSHVDGLKDVNELMIFIRYNMYKDNREAQQLADQDVVCKELSKRLVEDLPEGLVEECKYAARYRLDDMLRRSGISMEDYCAHNGITQEKLLADTDFRAVQSLREDTALGAYADHMNYTLEAEDFYAIIPGESIEEKAFKRRQIEADGRLAGMEEYALKTKALRDIMENAMIKREDDPNIEYTRYGDVSSDVLEANDKFPDAFVTL